MYQHLIGMSTGFRKMEYTWRDMALYALGVGTSVDELHYAYEKNMKAIPTFATLPCNSAVNVYPQRPTTYPAVFFVRDFIERTTGVTAKSMHMSSAFRYFRPLDAIKGSLVFEEKVIDVYDWGAKGLVVKTTMYIYDEAGRAVAEIDACNSLSAGGGYDGKPVPKSAVVFPDCEPDIVDDAYMTENQHLLYRLSGDVHPAHVDPDTAKEYGQPGPFMQGLCSYGYACRMAIKALIPGEPERMTAMDAQMRSIVFPDTEIQFQGWKMSDGELYFKLVNKKTGKAILDKGVFNWK